MLPEVYSPPGIRMVQYFDKARMEINNDQAPEDNLWYVTNGLLVVELITGRMQIGDADLVNLEPAQVNVVGDPDDPHTPTYATLARVLDAPAAADCVPLTQRIDRNGT